MIQAAEDTLKLRRYLALPRCELCPTSLALRIHHNRPTPRPLRALFHTQEFLEGRKAEAEGRKPVYRRNDRKSKQHATDSVSSKDKTMKLFTTVLLAAAGAFAQSSDRLPVTDADKIADALRAGPEFVTRDATLLDWPSAPGGEYRLLRKGPPRVD